MALGWRQCRCARDSEPIPITLTLLAIPVPVPILITSGVSLLSLASYCACVLGRLKAKPASQVRARCARSQP